MIFSNFQEIIFLFYRSEQLGLKIIEVLMTKCWFTVGLVLRYWANSKPALGQRFVHKVLLIDPFKLLELCTLALTLSSLNLPSSSSSTTSRELLSQFSTCSG